MRSTRGLRSVGSWKETPRKAAFAVMLATALVPSTVLGSGYALYEQGAAPLGMAGAATASVNDASAMFFNPAALTHLDGTHLHLGGTILTPYTSFAGVAPDPGFGVTEKTRRRTFFPPTIYLTHSKQGRWAIGAGLNSPFGLATDWENPNGFSGRHISKLADLKTVNAHANGAYAITPWLSVAVGANALFTRVRLERRNAVPIPGGGGASVDVAEVDLESDYTPGVGWNAAVSVTPHQQWRFGAQYRSHVVVDVDDGRATFQQISTGDPALDGMVAAGLPPDQRVSTVLHFPATWSAGVAWMPTTDWTLEADLNLVEWSIFRELPIRFAETPGANITIEENYEDSFQIRLGAEHRRSTWSYRFGYYFDEAAAPTASVSPILPDANRHGVTLGLGLALGENQRWSLDVYDLMVFVDSRDTGGTNANGFNGEYKSFVNGFGFGLTRRW